MKTFIAGDRFGEWVVVNSTTCKTTEKVLCRCSCGVEVAVRSSQLSYGKSTRCRVCARAEGLRTKMLSGVDEMSMNPIKRFQEEYRVWSGMKQRCHGPNPHKDYGGRGISVCSQWRGSFLNFLRDVGPRPSPEHSIDRRDVNGDYAPDNCRWATKTEQARNRRDSLYIRVLGVYMHIQDAVKTSGVPYNSIRDLLIGGVTNLDTETISKHKPTKVRRPQDPETYVKSRAKRRTFCALRRMDLSGMSSTEMMALLRKVEKEKIDAAIAEFSYEV